MKHPFAHIVVLPTLPFMRYYIDDEDGREENNLPRIDPIIGHDGWFWDRKKKLEWFEYKGQAFVSYGGTGTQFRYHLKLLNAHALNTREVAALQEVVKLGLPKAITQPIREMLHIDEQNKELRRIRTGYYRSGKR